MLTIIFFVLTSACMLSAFISHIMDMTNLRTITVLMFISFASTVYFIQEFSSLMPMETLSSQEWLIIITLIENIVCSFYFLAKLMLIPKEVPSDEEMVLQ